MSVRTRLYLLLFIVITAMALIQAASIRSSVNIEHSLQHLQRMQGLAVRTTEVSILTDLFLNHGEPRYRNAWSRNFKLLKAEMTASGMDMKRNGIRHAIPSMEAAFELIDEVRTRPAGYPDPVLRTRLLDRAASRILADVQLLLAATQDGVRTAAQDIRDARQEQQRDLMMVTLTLLLLAVVLVMWTQRTIMGSLRRLMRGTARIAEGDLSTRVRISGNDEHAQLAERFDHMATRLEATMANERSLHHEVQQRTDALARSNADLEQFASLASHDLKEPLRMINSFMQLLERQYADALDEKARTYIHFAVDGSARMSRLIDDMLEYAKLGRTAHDMAAVDTGHLLAEVKAYFSAELEAVQGKLSWTEMPVVHASALPLRMVFQNLVGNALKYHRDGVPPEVRITAHRETDHWRFEVADNGVGIPEKYQGVIFSPFKRLNNDPDKPGTGMGLAICERIIGQHGGRIGVRSGPGQGSTFRFTLPVH